VIILGVLVAPQVAENELFMEQLLGSWIVLREVYIVWENANKANLYLKIIQQGQKLRHKQFIFLPLEALLTLPKSWIKIANIHSDQKNIQDFGNSLESY
jgi:hypothetical protein